MKIHLNKTIGCSLLAAGLFLTSTSSMQAQFGGHYPVGAEGIKAATLPPPGLYLRDYNMFYFADEYKDGPADFDVFAYVNAPRLIWISEFKVLGGYYGADVLLPLGYSDVEVGPFQDDEFSIGDIHVEPATLSWHQENFDAAIGYAIWAPTGGFSSRHPARLGKGFWSHMFTAGATWYFDSEKTWALSALNRYEIHHEHEDFDITPGDTYSLEWGLSKTVCTTVDVGLVGYFQQQVTGDSGTGASNRKDSVIGLGPEIAGICPKLGLITSLRYLREFAAEDRPEGSTVTLTLTKRF